jgi:DNA-binding NtrC family response regulator
MVGSDVPVKELMEELQAEIIKLALKNNLYNRTYTAEALGMERATLNAQIKKFYYAGLLSQEEMTGKEI